MQTNYVTKKEYTGNNEATLEEAQEERGFNSAEWITFLQAQSIGKKVAKGSKGVSLARVINYKDKNKKGELKDKKGLKHFTVFNIEQLA